VVRSATEVGNTRPSCSAPESIAKIHEVCFYCLTSSFWDNLPPGDITVEVPDTMAHREFSPNQAIVPAAAAVEHPCMPLTKILSSGSFYYALGSHWDLSTRLASRLTPKNNVSKDTLAFDERFVWNDYIVRSLLDFRDGLDIKERDAFDLCQFIVCCSTRSNPCRLIGSHRF
jgi:synaptojanin